MKNIKIFALSLMTTLGCFAQEKMDKTSQSIKVNKNVVVDLNTSYVEIELSTWNRDIVEVEAYIESEKLSKEELKRALDSWNLKVEGSNDRVVISSTGSRSVGYFGEDDYAGVLRELELELAEIPEIPEMPRMPKLPKMARMPVMPDMPEMPEMPELPELPEGVRTITFDYDKYQKEGEKYMKEWSKKYEKEGGKELQKRMEEWAKRFAESGYQEKMKKWGEEYGKRFEGDWAKDMEKWGEKFGKQYGKNMEKWGEEFGEKFGEEWAKKMEVWGERFGKQMEQRAEAMEKRAERMAEREEERSERYEERAKLMEERAKEREERRSNVRLMYLNKDNSQVKKVIKIKIPKKAKLKTNIRHGELKISSVINNMKGEISHSYLLAEHIDGGDTSITVSYSPVAINTWTVGALNLNFVENAQIKNATNLVLNSKSSNITIDKLSDTGIIDGSFGDLTISHLSESFRNLNLILENSDAFVYLPKEIDFTLYFKGNRSKYNNKPISQKTFRNYPEGQSSSRTINVNAKYSNVIID